MHKNLSWNDLIDLRFQNDNASALFTYETSEFYTKEGKPGNRLPYDLSKYYKGPEYNGWIRLSLKFKKQFLKQARRLEGFTKWQRLEPNFTRGFIWELKPDAYGYADEFSKLTSENDHPSFQFFTLADTSSLRL